MSAARPMSSTARYRAYAEQNRAAGHVHHLTRRQERRWAKGIDATDRIDAGVTHGGTGVRVRRPIAMAGVRIGGPRPELRGSIVRYQARYCAPCDRHGRPRLHSTARVK